MTLPNVWSTFDKMLLSLNKFSSQKESPRTWINLVFYILLALVSYPLMCLLISCSFSVCLGASGDIAKCLELAEETPKLSRRSAHQLERFLLRRAHQMLEERCVLNQDYCLLLAYELLYLWNALGACLKHSHAAIQIGKRKKILVAIILLKASSRKCCVLNQQAKML